MIYRDIYGYMVGKTYIARGISIYIYMVYDAMMYIYIYIIYYIKYIYIILYIYVCWTFCMSHVFLGLICPTKGI